MTRTTRLTPPKHRSEVCYAKDHGACSCHGTSGAYTVRAANKAERKATRAMLRTIRQES